MTLDSWSTGDTITELNINKRGIRRGTTTDRDGLSAAQLTPGDRFFNETEECMQTLTAEGPNKWINDRILLGADSNEVSVTGTTPTERKVMDVIIDTTTFGGNQINIIVRGKTDDAGTTAHIRARWDDDATGPPAEVDMTTTSTAFVVLKGTLDISGEAVGRHTINFYMDDGGAGDTVTMDMTEIWGN